MVRSLLVLAALGGCYRYSFEQRRAPGQPTVTHVERRPTYLNGFVGRGTIDTSKYCDRPVKTELKVRASDVFLSVITLLIYTPHTLYVTCPVSPQTARSE